MIGDLLSDTGIFQQGVKEILNANLSPIEQFKLMSPLT